LQRDRHTRAHRKTDRRTKTDGRNDVGLHSDANVPTKQQRIRIEFLIDKEVSSLVDKACAFWALKHPRPQMK